MIQRNQNSDEFQAAIRAVDAGDVPTLRTILRDHPEVVHERMISHEVPYDGYFAHATLLHHVAGNPMRGRFPDNMVEVTRVLLAAGAAVDATCGGGPSQPNSDNWTTLGLVASGMVPAQKGITAELIDVLIDAGADVDHAEGMNVWAALFHTTEYQGQRDVARMLARHGARVDLGYAAGLGDRAAVSSLVNEDGKLDRDAYTRWRPADNRLAEPRPDQVLAEALCFAALCGHTETVELLLDRGADPTQRVAIVGERATAMHYAVWGDWIDVVQLMMKRGVDARARDTVHDTSVLGWALFLGRDTIAEWLAARDEVIDLRDAVILNRVDLMEELLGEEHPDGAFGDGDPGVLLRMAAAEGSLDACHWLLQRGADASLANREGKTAIDYARERGNAGVLGLLERHG